MDLQWQGKAAIVTGGSAEIGLAMLGLCQLVACQCEHLARGKRTASVIPLTRRLGGS
jgi:hypothetical protein